MHESFRQYVEALHPSFERLITMAPTKIEMLRSPLCSRCIYLFSEGDRHLYVGRTRKFRQRMRQHSVDGAGHNQAVFAFRLAREATGMTTAADSPEGSRQAMLQIPKFAAEFMKAKQQIREMDLRYVEETDPTRQALLEIYVSVALSTRYNDFNTH